jgi:hypothetical protein
VPGFDFDAAVECYVIAIKQGCWRSELNEIKRRGGFVLPDVLPSEIKSEAAMTVIHKYPTITNDQLTAVMDIGIMKLVEMKSRSGPSEGQRRLLKQLQARWAWCGSRTFTEGF